MNKLKTLQIIKTFPKNIHVMVASEGLYALAMGIFSFLQVLYYDFIGLSPETIGIIFSIGSLFTLVGFFIGPFIKMFGRKKILCIGHLVCGVGIGLHIFFSTFIMFILGQILISLGNSLVQVTEIQLLYSYTSGQKECCAYSYKYSINFISGAIGALIGGNINKIPYFINVGYRKLFFLSLIILIITASIRYLLLPRDITIEVEGNEVKKTVVESIKFLRVDKQTRIFAILLFITTIGFSAAGPYNNLILKSSFHLGNNIISYISFALTILSMIGLMLMPGIIEKIGVSKFNLSIFTLATGSCIILSLISNTGAFVTFLIVRCVFVILIISSLDSLMMSNIELKHRDIFAAVKMLVHGISIALGNLIGGQLLSNFGYRANYLYGGVILICAVAFFYLKVRGLMLNRTIDRSCPCHFKTRHIEYKR